MAIAHANGIDICYEDTGSPSDDDPVVLLVNGSSSPMISWDDRLIELFNEHGFRVVRYDNRDVGLTSKTPGDLPTFVPSDEGLPTLEGPPPYTLADMASDGIALLGELGVDKAHVVGASMGGMIVQHMAFGHPDHVLTMTSIMSTTGDRSVGQPKPEAMAALMTPPPTEREAYLDQGATTWRLISGPHYDEAKARDRAARSYDRAFYPQGAAFQMAAIGYDGDRTERLGTIRGPALVIHGRVDPLISVSGGEATAAAIPGAELIVLEDMGHDLPFPRLPDIVEAIAKLAARA
jgi:pimeloyl-ACP methyl ester carboxylesterase